MDGARNAILTELRSPEDRRAYADDFVNNYLALQIKAIRQQRKMSQEELAEAIGTQQSMISRLENVNNQAWTVSTLSKLAAAFDLPLQVRFGSWGEFIKDASQLSRTTLERLAFDEDPEFQVRDSTTFDLRSGTIADASLFRNGLSIVREAQQSTNAEERKAA